MSTDFIRRKAFKWKGFIFTAALYIIIDLSKIYTTWVTAVDDNVAFKDISWHDKTTLLALMLGGAAVTLRGLMNTSFHDAKQEGTTTHEEVTTNVSTTTTP